MCFSQGSHSATKPPLVVCLGRFWHRGCDAVNAAVCSKITACHVLEIYGDAKRCQTKELIHAMISSCQNVFGQFSVFFCLWTAVCVQRHPHAALSILSCHCRGTFPGVCSGILCMAAVSHGPPLHAVGDIRGLSEHFPNLRQVPHGLSQVQRRHRMAPPGKMWLQ